VHWAWSWRNRRQRGVQGRDGGSPAVSSGQWTVGAEFGSAHASSLRRTFVRPPSPPLQPSVRNLPVHRQSPARGPAPRSLPSAAPAPCRHPPARPIASASTATRRDGCDSGMPVGQTFAIAAVSVGRRRTFYPHDGQRLLEAHLLDFSLNLYGRRLRVHLFERLRGQEAFSTIEALVEQLHLDVGRTREWACGHYPWLTSPALSDSPVGVQA
jgi:hypothetical protein